MKKRSFFAFAGAVMLAVAVLSCASTDVPGRARLTKTPQRMFWRIDGTDAKGNPSTVYIQGTFHLGDEQIYPLAQEVQDAFLHADRLAGEISSKGYEELTAIAPKLSAPNKEGKIVTDYLSSEEKAVLVTLLGSEAALAQASVLDPWQLTTALAVALYVNTGLSAEYGLDNAFIASATQQGRTWEGLDELQVQLDVMTFGDYDTQVQMLKDTLKAFIDEKEAEKSVDFTKKLYKNYVSDNVRALTRLFNESNAEEEGSAAFYKDYHELVYAKRNEDWARDITAYLEKGGTTFIFAGTAHWLGDDSVFSFLRKMGTIN